MFDFIFKRHEPLAENFLTVRDRQIPLTIVRNDKAVRYVLRLRPDGSARLTIPHRGSIAEGRRFADRQSAWLVRQLERLAAQPAKSSPWQIGTEILFRGEIVRLELVTNEQRSAVRFGEEIVRVADVGGDLRPPVMRHLWKLAAKELVPRVFELATTHQLTVRRVTVRNQRSRWGSCSPRGTVSLNWRLIQAPVFVRDYIILHELMHLRQMNHSARFWREVERVCPDYQTAEKWLKQNRLLRA